MTTVRQRYYVGDISSEVFTAKFSPDGILIATGSNDGRVRIYDSSTGVQRHVLDGMVTDRIATNQATPAPSALGSEGLPITSLRWRPQTFAGDANRHVALAVSADGSVRHWNAMTGQWMGTVIEVPMEEGPGGMILPGRGGQAAAGKGSLSISLGGSSTGTGAGSAAALKTALAGRMPHQVFACEFRPDGAAFATAGKDKAVRVYDEETGKLATMCAGGGSDGITPGHSNRVFALAWHPTEQHLILSAGWDGTIQVQDTRVGHAVRGMYGAHVCGDALAWLPEGLSLGNGAGTTGSGSLFLTGSWRQAEAVQVWDYGTGRCVGGLHWWHGNPEATAWGEATATARAGGKDGPAPPRDGGFVYALSVSKAGSAVTGSGLQAGAYVAAGGSGGNEVKVWRTGAALTLGAAPGSSIAGQGFSGDYARSARPVAGTVTDLSHAVYGLDWTEMVPAELGRVGGPSAGAAGDADAAADEAADSSAGKDTTRDNQAPLPTGPVPTLLVAGGEQPLRVLHVLDSVTNRQLAGPVAVGTGAGAKGKAPSRPSSGKAGDSRPGSAGTSITATAQASGEPGWSWRDGDWTPPPPQLEPETPGADSWDGQGQTPTGQTPTAGAASGSTGEEGGDGPGLPPRAPKGGAPASGLPARLPPSLRRGSAALRAVMDARMANLGAAEDGSSGVSPTAGGTGSGAGLATVQEEGSARPGSRGGRPGSRGGAGNSSTGGGADGGTTPNARSVSIPGVTGAATTAADEARLLQQYGGEEQDNGQDGEDNEEEEEDGEGQ